MKSMPKTTISAPAIIPIAFNPFSAIFIIKLGSFNTGVAYLIIAESSPLLLSISA
jgi:hypothetical protein